MITVTEPQQQAYAASETRPVLVVAGGTGLVGRHLIVQARDRYTIRVLSRSSRSQDPAVQVVSWDPQAAARGAADALAALRQALEGASAVVNLAGASIGEGRLTPQQQRRVLQSRLDATNALVEACLRCTRPPSVWVQASAVGYYGDTGDLEVDETCPPQPGFFLSDVCVAWERAARRIESRADGAVRLVITRFGLVLGPDAPAWQRLLLPLRLGVAGPFGSGRQWWPWVDVDDVARAICFLIEHPECRDVYNVTAPDPVRQIDFVRRAARRLHRPAVIPVPAWALRLVLGPTADQLLLVSCRAVPRRLRAAGFDFLVPLLDTELDRLLGPRAR